MDISPTAHLRNARGLVANVDGSLAFCIAQDADPGVLAQQVPFVIGELRHAIEHLEEAQAKAAAKQLRTEARAAA